MLERAIARVRTRANSRLWRLLAARITPDHKRQLDALLVTPNGGRQSPMDRLRSGPTRQSTPELVRAIERLDELRQLAAAYHAPIAYRRPVLAPAVFADAAKAQAVARLPDERRVATLLAFIRALEASAQDDVLDLFDRLVTRMFVDAIRKGREARLRGLRDLDAAALTLSKVCALVLDGAVDDGDLRVGDFCRHTRGRARGRSGPNRHPDPTAGRSLLRRVAGAAPSHPAFPATLRAHRRFGCYAGR